MNDDPTAGSTPGNVTGTSGSTGAGRSDESARQAQREHARRMLRASGIPEMLRALNHQALKGRGAFDEYDTGVILRWGTGYTRRHIWVDVQGDAVRIRLREHLPCRAPVPACDGEYHSFTPETWGDRSIIEREIQRAYQKPVAEASED